ncbi:MAG: trypsin-like serine protease [Burkholderiales bacterium]|nr:MAG: trypsin-like serine protease [Burkholderiales bacterium]
MLVGNILHSAEASEGCQRMRAAPVVGGVPANVNDWRGLVALRVSRRSESRYFCGATYIGNNTLLTAAHCVEKLKRDEQGGVTLQGWDSVEAVPAADDLSKISSQGVVRITNVLVHPGWNGRVQSGNDIAVLKVAAPSTWRKPLPLSSTPLNDTVYRALVAGYGLLQDPIANSESQTWTSDGIVGSAGSRLLQEVQLPVLPTSTCSLSQESFRGDSQFCAGYEDGGKDACTGDSGGPLVAIDSMGCPYQIGIVSYGRGCGRKQTYGIYTRISAFLPWLHQILNDSSLGGVLPPPEAAGVASASALSALLQVATLDGDDITLALLPRTLLTVGEALTIRVSVRRKGRLLLLDQNAAGSVSQIFPNAAAIENSDVVQAGQTLDFPPTNAGYHFAVLPPTGNGRLVALLMPINSKLSAQAQYFAKQAWTANQLAMRHLLLARAAVLDGLRSRSSVAALSVERSWSAVVLNYTVQMKSKVGDQ